MGVTDETLEVLRNYSWPGNIRELRNVIEHAFIIESSDYLQVSSLPEGVRKQANKNVLSDERDQAIINYNDIKDSVLDEANPREPAESINLLLPQGRKRMKLKWTFR